MNITLRGRRKPLSWVYRKTCIHVMYKETKVVTFKTQLLCQRRYCKCQRSENQEFSSEIKSPGDDQEASLRVIISFSQICTVSVFSHYAISWTNFHFPDRSIPIFDLPYGCVANEGSSYSQCVVEYYLFTY